MGNDDFTPSGHGTQRPWVRWWPQLLAVLSVMLCLPSLDVGFLLDDHYHRVMIQGHPQLGEPRESTDLFAFGGVSESPPSLVPWWAPEDLRFRFFRPLTSLTHALDHALWPESPRWMHAHSLLWLGLTVLAAALFLRQIAPSGTVAFLAALLFAVDDGHAAPVSWLANRSALIALFFALLTLLVHHRHRRLGSKRGHGSKWGAAAAPAALALAMLAGESGIAAGAYLLAYALFLDDRGDLRERFLALWPCVTVGVVWAAFYKLHDFGTSASGLYVDPTGEPLRFAATVIERAPILLLGQFGMPPSDATLYLSQSASSLATWAAAGFAALMAWLIWPVLREQASARFAAFGMALSLLPICAPLPSNRLLGAVSIGGSLLLAMVLERAWRRGVQGFPGAGRAWRVTVKTLTPVFVLMHLVLAPLILLTLSSNFKNIERYFVGPGATLPQDDSERVVLVNVPNFYLAALAPISQAANGRTLPEEVLTLVTSVYAIDYERLDLHTLRVRPQGGFLMPPGTAPESEQAPAASFLYFLQTADQLYWDGEPFQVGQEIRRAGVTVRVASVTPDGRPAEVDFVLDDPLEQAGLRWVRFVEWQGFVDWQPPAVGQVTRVEALGPSR